MPREFYYNHQILDESIKRDNAILLNIYDKVTKRTVIYFKCQCGEEGHKQCIQVVKKGGAFCKKCTLKHTLIRTLNTIENEKGLICSQNSLNEIIKRDNATLLHNYDVITQHIDIKFKCSCGEESKKNCLQLIKVSGAFCKSCTRKTWTQRIKDTNMEKYGVECTVHAELISKQIKENNLKKYGVENVLQSKNIKDKIKTTMLEKYGVEHISQSVEIKEKVKQTCIERYGGHNPMCSNEVKEKLKNTVIERYGVEHISKTQKYKDKFKETCLKKYGVEHILQAEHFKAKVKQSFIKHYGVDNPNKTKEVRDKIKQTCLERYGVENPSQCQEIQEKTQKNAKKYKEYKMPSGAIRKVQGYEPFALDELIKTLKEDDIRTDRKDVPRIKYKSQEKQRYYFPDIYIPSENRIIEVKSTWTYQSKTDNIKEKEEATKAAGYTYEIWIYDKKGNKQSPHTTP